MSFLLAGIKIIESPLCERVVPVRRHKKRRNQTEAYHRRVQKKWTKRWGTKKERVAFLINPGALGNLMGGETVALHPRDFAMLKGFA